MFDIGFFELLVIAIVGLLVIGPERLPEAVRTTAKWWSRIKHTLSNARQELEREVGADDIRREIHNEAVLRELRESREQIKNQVEKAVSGGEPAVHEAEDYLPEQEDDEEGLDEVLEDPEYPEHLHDHGDPDLNPDHPQHSQDKPPRGKDSDS